MKLTQECVQLIPCRNQMFSAEAASTENLNAEFASALMQGSPDIAALQDINRIIVAPKQIEVALRAGGMLALAIQKLDTAKYKLTDLFLKEKSAAVTQTIINNCNTGYASVFSEKDFIKLYGQINQQNPLARSNTLNLNCLILPNRRRQIKVNMLYR